MGRISLTATNAQIDERARRKKRPAKGPTPVAVDIPARKGTTRKRKPSHVPRSAPLKRGQLSRYVLYLRSAEWKAKRAAVLKRDKKCRSCGSTRKLQVHHLTYERIYRERLTDLTTLCEGCHRRVHRSKT
jgi:hypothetical protein